VSSTGVPQLDEVLADGLHEGDNVVWIGDDRAVLQQFARAFLTASVPGARRFVLTSGRLPVDEAGIEVIDARPRRHFADPLELERSLVDRPDNAGARIVVDTLDDLTGRWGTTRAVAFFTRVCPRLFDAGAIAYWTASRSHLNAAAVDRILRVTQCVFECTGLRLRILKAEDRAPRVQGTIVSFRTDDDGTIRLERELALGRLAEGLQRIRRERQLTQLALARLAGVSPSAISQAEAGRRGLSLDTLLVLCDRLGLGLDDLLGRPPRVDHVLARRGRRPSSGPIDPLFDDPRAGLRLHRIRLEGGERGAPPVPHKGVEAIVVATGLVMIDLGTTTPVLRAGDGVLATQVAISEWRNLLAEPAVLYWVLRDDLRPDGG
jgi:transcriptional regulator with XRE-family HTH domain